MSNNNTSHKPEEHESADKLNVEFAEMQIKKYIESLKGLSGIDKPEAIKSSIKKLTELENSIENDKKYQIYNPSNILLKLNSVKQNLSKIKEAEDIHTNMKETITALYSDHLSRALEQVYEHGKKPTTLKNTSKQDVDSLIYVASSSFQFSPDELPDWMITGTEKRRLLQQTLNKFDANNQLPEKQNILVSAFTKIIGLIKYFADITGPADQAKSDCKKLVKIFDKMYQDVKDLKAINAIYNQCEILNNRLAIDSKDPLQSLNEFKHHVTKIQTAASEASKIDKLAPAMQQVNQYVHQLDTISEADFNAHSNSAIDAKSTLEQKIDTLLVEIKDCVVPFGKKLLDNHHRSFEAIANNANKRITTNTYQSR